MDDQQKPDHQQQVAARVGRAQGGTPQHQRRVRDAEERELRGEPEVVRQWIEINRRVPNEVGKVVLMQTVKRKNPETGQLEGGNTHKWYVGRFPKCVAWLKEQEKAGVEIWDGPRDGGQGRKFKWPKGTV